MDRQTFLLELARDQFPDPVLVTREAGGQLSRHAHAFEARALVLEGEITLEVDGRSTSYGPGAIFRLPAHQAHSERYGPQGVVYLAGRK